MQSRQQIYWILIAVSCGLMFGRIIAVDNIPDRESQRIKLGQIESVLANKKARLEKDNHSAEAIEAELLKTRAALEKDAQRERAFLSANDRSRWATIRALVEPNKRVVREIDGKPQFVWYAIDVVQDEIGWDTIDMCKHTLSGDPNCPGYLFSTKPPLLPTIFAVPYALMYFASNGSISFDTHAFFIVRTTLVIVNLLPMLFCFVLMSKMIERYGTSDWGRIFAMAFVCFGTFASTFVITLNNHLPAIFCVVIAMYAGLRIWMDGERRLRYFAICGFFGTFAAVCDLPALGFTAFLGLPLLIRFPKQTLIAAVPCFAIIAIAFFGTNYLAHKTINIAYSNKDWYDYTYTRNGVQRDSYWNNRSPIDKGEESIPTYFLHTTVGHHGVLSLTPIWILSIFGLGIWAFQRTKPKLRYYALLTFLLTIIVFAFYVTIRQEERNYGGMTSGLRWTFWLIPLWTLLLLPTLDVMSKCRFCRGFALLFLAMSAMSVSYPVWNPWTHPWIYYFLQYLGVSII